ncbi:MAG: response regulator [Magnetococcus sp. YQC-5]
MKILIADDELNNRVLLHHYLASWGQCDLVNDGTEVLEAYEMAMAEGQPYDLICMDLFMQIMNGDEALRNIRLHERRQGISVQYKIFIIIITGHESIHDEEFLDHSDHCTIKLTKPFTSQQLYTALQANGFFIPESCATYPISPTDDVAPPLDSANHQVLCAIAGLDVVSGLERVMGNAELYLELLGHFFADHHDDMEKIHTIGTNRSAVVRLLHSLKGAAGNISATRVHLAAAALEDVFLHDHTPEQRAAPLAELDAAMQELMSALRLAKV